MDCISKERQRNYFESSIFSTTNHHPYRPQTNGVVEAANKNIGRILKKNTKNYRDWHLQLPYALWGYRTSIRSSIGATPYSLVYVVEVVLPIEMGIRSLRTILESEIPKVDWLQSRYDQLCMMDEKRLKALYHIQSYQRRLRKGFDKKVRVRDLKTRDSVEGHSSPNPRNKWEVQAELGRSIYYQAYIFWRSNKVDGLRCKPFY